MASWDDLRKTTIDDGPGRVRFRLHEWEKGGRAGRDVGEVVVTFDLDVERTGGRASEISVRLVDGLTARDLQRFAWASVLTAAAAYTRSVESWRAGETTTEAALEELSVKARKAWTKAQPSDVRARLAAFETVRPGRKGHPPEFYEAIARRYLELVAAGVKAPTQALQDECFTNRNTISRWLRRARELELLPPAHQGRAG